MKVLDTDTCIEILRGNQSVLARREAERDDVATTWITACALAYGAANSSYPEQNRELVKAFLATLPVLSLSEDSAFLFGSQKARLRRAAITVADADLMIAAIAIVHGAMLVTGNLRHYNRIDGLSLEDWIRPPPASAVAEPETGQAPTAANIRHRGRGPRHPRSMRLIRCIRHHRADCRGAERQG